ncbi:helicase-like protein [Trifolium pratense]|uniref:Helicase-like protein n=1 Tax=Trifolium pratense TaxID=57577 RepID=A0A2K3N4C6_TRIPR|nr:helicase-like protein [Trifolium pratense]
MDYNTIEKANAGLARLKRRRSTGTKTNFTRNYSIHNQQDISDSDTDSEVEIDLDETSSSESEPEMEQQNRFSRNMSYTVTGNPSFQGYDDLGDALCECEECGSFMWYQERKGMEIEGCKNGGIGPPNLRIQGQTCHRIGTMLPEIGDTPKYAQLYIYDTENEIDNRLQCFRNNKSIHRHIVRNLTNMLDEHNVHVKSFRMARDLLKDGNVQDFKLKLISERTTDGRIYNQPTVSEVAALIVGDVDTAEKRDIILHKRGGTLQRIDEFHPAYLSYQYPLIFPFGEDGYRDGILLKYKDETIVNKRNRLTIKAWLSYRIQSRKSDAQTLLCSRRLLQQFLVDGFTMMEAERLNKKEANELFFRHHLLAAEDILINCIMMAWLYQVKLDFQISL